MGSSSYDGATGVTGTQRRYAGLDGLRGVAAVAVVLTHLLPLAPSLHAYESPDWPHDFSAWQHWIAYTPAHLFWMGSEAVFVFFVLSGFVLTLSATRAGGPGERRAFWRSYYPSRLLRLYLPIWASFVLAWLLLQTVHNPDRLTEHLPFVPDHHTAAAMLGHATALFGTGSMNLPLWSLRWELWFSLLLPAYLLVGRLRKSIWPVLAVVGSLLVVAVGLRTGEAALQFLPIFLLGVVLAFQRDRVVAFGDALGRRSRLALPALALLAVLLATARYSAIGLAGPESPVVLVATVASVAGAGLLVVVTLVWAPLDAVLARPVTQYLGERSYSLYLVHMPIVTALTSALGTERSWLLFPAALAASFAVAEVFYRVVERPAHRASRAVGRRLRRGGQVPERHNFATTDRRASVSGVTAVKERH